MNNVVTVNMMTELNLKDIKQKLIDISGAEEKGVELKALNSRYAELQTLQQYLSKLTDKIDVLKQANKDGGTKISIQIVLDRAPFKTIRDTIHIIIEGCADELTSKILMGGNCWNALDKKINSQSEVAISACNDNWAKFVINHLGQKPEDIDFPQTPENTRIFGNYYQKFSDGYDFINKYSLENTIDIKAFLKIADQLHEIYKQFNMDAPDDVKKFLQCARNPEGFSLENYTPKINKWLEENKLTERYTIRNKT
jgi:hypothetical protein